MSMATAASPNSASNPLSALGGNARAPDDGGSSSGSGSSAAGIPSFNSAMAAAQSSRPSQGSSGSGTPGGSSSSSVGATSSDPSDESSDASTAANVPTSVAAPPSGKPSARSVAARAMNSPGAAKAKTSALLRPVSAAEQIADSDESLAVSDARDVASAPSGAATEGSDAEIAKSAVTEAPASTPLNATPIVSDSVAQALAGLVHQLLAKDSRTEAQPAANVPVAADGADIALATLSSAAATVAKTAVGAGAALTGLGKLIPDNDPTTDSDDVTGASDAPAQGAVSAAALAVAAGTQPPAATGMPERVITVPVQSSQWPQALATEIRWLTGQNIQSAVLRLSPDHLGPVQVNISVNASHVSVSFGAAHPDTRAALEQAMPRLRDMLSGAGLTLGEATVQQQSRQASQNSHPAARGLLNGADTDAQPAAAVTWRAGLVDEYA